MDRFVWITFFAAGVFGGLDWVIPSGHNSVSISIRLHVVFGMAWLLGIPVHLVLHRKWITTAARRYLRVKKGDKVIIQPDDVKDLTISTRKSEECPR